MVFSLRKNWEKLNSTKIYKLQTIFSTDAILTYIPLKFILRHQSPLFSKQQIEFLKQAYAVVQFFRSKCWDNTYSNTLTFFIIQPLTVKKWCVLF